MVGTKVFWNPKFFPQPPDQLCRGLHDQNQGTGTSLEDFTLGPANKEVLQHHGIVVCLVMGENTSVIQPCCASMRSRSNWSGCCRISLW